MSKTEQMRLVLIAVWAGIVLLVLMLIVVAIAKAADGDNSTNTLSDTAMWALGLILSGFIAVAAVLRKHENAIVKMQSSPEAVSVTVCETNMSHVNSEFSHGSERFERIESAMLDKASADQKRHEELMEFLKTLKN